MSPADRTLPEALEAAASSNAGIVFLVNGVEQRRSYAELLQRSLGVAAALRQSGLRRGDAVALAIEDAESFLTALIGASMARLIPVSLAPPGVTADLSSYVALTTTILRTACARGVVASARLVPAFEARRADCPAIEMVLPRDAVETDAAERRDWPAIDDIAFVQFTSGSTSSPKGIALTHRNLAANIDAINGPAGLTTTSEDSAVSWLPLHHDMGLVGMVLGPLYAARPAVLMTPQAFVKRPADWLKTIARHRATVSFAPNFAYDLVVRRIREQDLNGLDLSSWRIAGCGAEPIHESTLAAFADRLAGTGFRSSSFFPCYGLAEHVLAATLPPCNRPPRIDSGRVGCGRALPGHRVRVVRPDGSEAGEGEEGELTLAGPSVMQGYYNDRASTAEILRDGWLHTGDLGYIRGGDLFVSGRLKEIIIVNGHKYHPQDLEWALDGVEGTRHGRTVAFGVSPPGEPTLGGRDRVVIVLEAATATAFDTLVQGVRRRISDVFGLYVDDVVAVPAGAIERTTSGKIRRAAMKIWYQARHGD
jgi:acyl-CoA synthetase (AMP-forming)/AMP-acid ligase II